MQQPVGVMPITKDVMPITKDVMPITEDVISHTEIPVCFDDIAPLGPILFGLLSTLTTPFTRSTCSLRKKDDEGAIVPWHSIVCRTTFWYVRCTRF